MLLTPPTGLTSRARLKRDYGGIGKTGHRSIRLWCCLRSISDICHLGRRRLNDNPRWETKLVARHAVWRTPSEPGDYDIECHQMASTIDDRPGHLILGCSAFVSVSLSPCPSALRRLQASSPPPPPAQGPMSRRSCLPQTPVR